MKTDLSPLMQAMGYTFRNVTLLETALTHSSYANERHGGLECNERLEFLGDAVLGMIAATYLYDHDNRNEGTLSKLRSSVVCSEALASYSRELDVGQYLRLGHGEAMGGGANRTSILENVFEALTAAVYLDGGLEAARRFALPFLEKELATRRQAHFKDYKTQLQEIVQQNPGERVEYVHIGESGPDHDKKCTVEVHLNSNGIGRGVGRSKKEAEQQAAREALALMGY